MKKRILFFLSEILSAKTLTPLIETVRRDPAIQVAVINDGFCVDFIRTLNIPFNLLDSNFENAVVPFLEWADLIIMGKSYEQKSEYIIIEKADSKNIPLLLVIPDMGIDIVKAKLRGLGTERSNKDIPVPILLLADPMTRNSLAELGIPPHRMIEAGNPYFDDLYLALCEESPDAQQPRGVAYFSTPFELDWERGILPAEYRQIDLIDEIAAVCEELDVPLIGKRHPQVDPLMFRDMEMFEGAPLDLLRRVNVSVGSYSTTLLESYVAGVPTVSYQPWESNIRADVFDGRIPIAKSFDELKEFLKNALEVQRKVMPGGNIITYNPGSSLQRYQELAREILMGLPTTKIVALSRNIKPLIMINAVMGYNELFASSSLAFT